MKKTNPMQLFLAISASNVDEVKRLLRNDRIKVIVNAVNIEETPLFKKGVTPLFLAAGIAASTGNTEIVRLLLDQGADVNKKYPFADNSTVLHAAAQRGQVSIVQLLLDKKAEINVRDGGGTTPLHLACEKEHSKVVNMLLEKNADVNAVDSKKVTPLIFAAHNGHLKIVEALLINGAIITDRVIRIATDLQVVRLLESYQKLYTAINRKDIVDLKRVLETDIILPNSFPPLAPEILLIILQKRPKKNFKAIFDELTFTLKATHWEITAISADDIQMNRNAQITFYHTPKENTFELKAKSFSITTVLEDTRIELPLDLLLREERKKELSVVKREIKREIIRIEEEKSAALKLKEESQQKKNLEKKQREKEEQRKWQEEREKREENEKVAELKRREAMQARTPLHAAVFAGNYEEVQRLLNEEPDINIDAPNRKGNTPLHIAASQRYVEIYTLLRSRGANQDLKNRGNRTPLDIFRQNELDSPNNSGLKKETASSTHFGKENVLTIEEQPLTLSPSQHSGTKSDKQPLRKHDIRFFTSSAVPQGTQQEEKSPTKSKKKKLGGTLTVDSQWHPQSSSSSSSSSSSGYSGPSPK